MFSFFAVGAGPVPLPKHEKENTSLPKQQDNNIRKAQTTKKSRQLKKKTLLPVFRI